MQAMRSRSLAQDDMAFELASLPSSSNHKYAPGGKQKQKQQAQFDAKRCSKLLQ
jgi:hypothetical protein